MKLFSESEPVANSASLSALLVVLVNAGVAWVSAMGWVQWDEAQQAATNAVVVAAINVAAILGPALFARSKITPLAEPRDTDDTPLVRAGGALPLEVQKRSLKGG